MSVEVLRDMDWRLLLVGPDGGVEKPLRRLAKTLGLNSRIQFLGPVGRERVKDILAATDILALISRHENFGNAAVEAMLAGVPVLVSEHVGICREVREDRAGVVVPLTIEAVSRALREMLTDPEKLRTMGQSAAAALG